MEEKKTCTKCKESKDVEEFYTEARKQCIDCELAYHRKYKAFKNELLLRKLEHRINHMLNPEYLDRIKEEERIAIKLATENRGKIYKVDVTNLIAATDDFFKCENKSHNLWTVWNFNNEIEL